MTPDKSCSSNPTRLNVAFDDPKDVMDVLLSENVVDFQGDDVVLVAQSGPFPT